MLQIRSFLIQVSSTLPLLAHAKFVRRVKHVVASNKVSSIFELL